MNGSLLIRHLMISLIPAILALIVGGGLGYASAVIARAMVSTNPSLRKWLTLFPWHTLMLAVLYFTSPIYLVFFFGLGDLTEALSVGATTLSFAFSLTAVLLFEYWYPPALRVRLFALARTLLAASIMIGTREAVGLNGVGGGIGSLIFQARSTLHFQQELLLWLIVVVLILVVDPLLGIIQLMLYNSAAKIQNARSAIPA